MGLIIATFAALDNLFLKTVSQEVDKIRGFEHSHYATMRGVYQLESPDGCGGRTSSAGDDRCRAWRAWRRSRAAVSGAARESFMSSPAFELLPFISIANLSVLAES